MEVRRKVLKVMQHGQVMSLSKVAQAADGMHNNDTYKAHIKAALPLNERCVVMSVTGMQIGVLRHSHDLQKNNPAGNVVCDDKAQFDQ